MPLKKKYNKQNLRLPSWVEIAVVYQIFPDRFKRSKKSCTNNNLEFLNWEDPPELQGFRGGDLFGVIEKLDYLNEMGINCIYLNPIFSSAANHRYHTYDYFRIDPILGGDEALYSLIDELHKRDMFIVLDGVFNHCGRGFWPFHHIIENGKSSPYKNWFNLHETPFNPYPKKNETCGYDCWWNDPALPKFNFKNKAVEDFLLSVGKYWVEKGIDGWRLDVAKEIPFSFWDKFNYEMKSINSEIWVVGEIWGDARKWLNKKYFDGVMNYRVGWSTLSWVADFKLNSPYKNPFYPLKNLTSKEYLNILNITESWYSKENNIGNLNLLDSHDVPRALNTLDKDIKSLKLALFLLLLNKGVPCIYYGTEIGLSGGSEPYCRESFPSTNQFKIDIREFIKAIIKFRRKFRVSIKEGIKWTSPEENIICGNLNSKKYKIIVFVNRSKLSEFYLPKKYSKIIFKSDESISEEVLAPQSFICYLD